MTKIWMAIQISCLQSKQQWFTWSVSKYGAERASLICPKWAKLRSSVPLRPPRCAYALNRGELVQLAQSLPSLLFHFGRDHSLLAQVVGDLLHRVEASGCKAGTTSRGSGTAPSSCWSTSGGTLHCAPHWLVVCTGSINWPTIPLDWKGRAPTGNGPICAGAGTWPGSFQHRSTTTWQKGGSPLNQAKSAHPCSWETCSSITDSAIFLYWQFLNGHKNSWIFMQWVARQCVLICLLSTTNWQLTPGQVSCARLSTMVIRFSSSSS